MERINLLNVIKNPPENSPVEFSGAIFLTYSLNLGFFERIVQPALEKAGCQNILILSDPDGYNEAIEFGRNNVRFAGMRYVCNFIPRHSNSVQHIKLLFLVGPDAGRLLVGSGNLTLHGYSKNLEVYTFFEYNHSNPDPDSLYAFYIVNSLMNLLVNSELSSQISTNHYQSIIEKAEWLQSEPILPENFRVWHNYYDSIWSQLTSWRNQSEFTGRTLKSLHVFSPYYDSDVNMLRKFLIEFLPDDLTIHISPENSNLDGLKFPPSWPAGFPLPELFAVKDVIEDRSDRLLHGKVIIGIEEFGSWCLAGSPNMTRAAFDKSWSDGSNLEMAVFRWSSEPHTFDNLIEQITWSKPISLKDIEHPVTTIQSDQPKKVTINTLTLVDLSFHNELISGRLNKPPHHGDNGIFIVFPKTGDRIRINLNEDLTFSCTTSLKMDTSQIAYIEFGNMQSLPRWIDVPKEIQYYGRRSYQQRIKVSLDTVSGTEGLFYELMKYLDFTKITTPDDPGMDRGRKSRPKLPDTDSNDVAEPVPDHTRFIVPEQDADGNFIIDDFTRIPYDRRIRSLQDLLSIILLKLTHKPQEVSTTIEGEDSEKEDIQPEHPEEIMKINARERICKYILGYCKKYSKNLSSPDMLIEFPLKTIIEKHFTLCRVLLEIKTHLEEFTSDDFCRCYWLIWAPFVWPALTNPEGVALFDFVASFDKTTSYLELWHQNYLSEIFVVMTSITFGMPVAWSSGLHMPKKINTYLAVQELINRFEDHLGILKWQNLSLDMFGISQFETDLCNLHFALLRSYLPPVRERFSPIFEWKELFEKGEKPNKDLLQRIVENNLVDELESYKSRIKPIISINPKSDDEGHIYCPRCGGALREPAVRKILWGKLALCTTGSDVWLYKQEKLDISFLNNS